MTGVLTAGEGARSTASPVLAEWFLGWDDALRDPDREALRPYASRLVGSGGTIDQEVARQWLVIDWLVRVAAPLWLRGAHLVEHADQLARQHPIRDRRSLANAARPAEVAAQAAHDADELAWTSVADLAQPAAHGAHEQAPWRPVSNTEPRRVSTWGGLADGTRAAMPATSRLLGPASRATGYGLGEIDDAPPAWRAATRAVIDASSVIAWNATSCVVSARGWSWNRPGEDAWRIAHTAARSALESLETAYMACAHALVDRMFRITENVVAPAPPTAGGSW